MKYRRANNIFKIRFTLFEIVSWSAFTKPANKAHSKSLVHGLVQDVTLLHKKGSTFADPFSNNLNSFERKFELSLLLDYNSLYK